MAPPSSLIPPASSLIPPPSSLIPPSSSLIPPSIEFDTTPPFRIKAWYIGHSFASAKSEALSSSELNPSANVFILPGVFSCPKARTSARRSSWKVFTKRTWAFAQWSSRLSYSAAFAPSHCALMHFLSHGKVTCLHSRNRSADGR
ncbi:hypothetical protein D1012_03775 [Pseudotabrizicola alkalilacus]|uniref:Uncharacterized protein n=1 Tax=Pseudotabrizicola alkalilacus TaxID=2305252 RepID=A0A411Z8A6_9RHOB|nr:hypothetical protein D1012_03775 [Pseudotabrizicola alkalilacus]